MGSNTPIIVGCVVGAACVIGLVVGIVCCIRHLRRALRVPQPPVYAVAESVALHEESEFGAAVRSQHSAATAPSPDAGRNGPRSAQDRRDNYADRNAVDYRAEATGRYVELDGGVRPASPNAERVDGVPIEARVRPRRNLPRGRVVVTNGDQDVCLDFSGVERVPQAGPPPLTHEEKQRLEDERNRVASPEYYGHAEYEFRRASNRSSPNVLLSSSLLHELQRQYGAASASGHAFTPFAGDGSVRSMSFRPGSPAGSARRARHGQQSATPNSASLGNGSVGGLPFLRRRKTPSGRNGAGDGATPKQRRQPRSTSSAPRNHNDDLESTSDDFEDVSLPNASFNARREQLREFLLRQQDHQHMRGRFSPTTGIEYANGFDHVSLRGTSPVFPDRQTSAAAAGGHLDRGGSAMAGSAVSPLDQSAPSYPLHLPQPTTTTTQGLPPLGGSFQSYPSGPSTTVNTPLVALNGVPPFPQIQLPPANHSATAAGLHSTPAASVAAAQAREAGKPPRTSLSTATRHVDVPVAPPPNRHSSGLRSPFSLPGNDPVTASDSPSSGEARTHRSAHVSPLQRPGGGVDLRLRHPHTDPNGAGGNQRTAVKNGMAYHQKRLDAYRQLIAEGKPFRCATCPYCNGTRDATVQHIHPSTKPATPSAFWEDVLVRKYAAVQSHAARANMTTNTTDAAGGSRMCVVGPMVDQSELPFRMLCRQYGAALAYTPMLHAKSFAEGAVYRAHFLTTSPPAEVAAAMVASAAHTSTQKTGGDLADGGGLDGGSGAGEGEANAVADAALVDRPCIVQFCGHDADTVLRAARFAVLGEQAAKLPDRGGDSSTPAPPAAAAGGDAEYPVHVRVGGAGCETEHRLYQCDAVDLNLGCPQGIARRGHYGSFLMEDWDLVHTIIHTLHVELEVPVTVKIRVFDHPGHTDADGPSTHRGGRAGDEEEEDAAAAVAAAADEEAGWEQRKEDFDEALTVLYARMIRDAGAQVLCIHGRTREMKGQQTGLANMDLIRRVREALGGSIPVISNGNVRTFDDVVRHLADTRCEGHMCAEPLLWDPRLFSRPARPVMPGRTHGADKLTRLAALHTALVYMQWVRRYPVDMGFVKAHLFKMCFHSYELHTGFRETLAQLKTSAATLKELERGDASEAMQSMQGRVAASCSSGGGGGGCAAVEDEESAAVAAATAAASVTASAFALYVDAIEAHLRALVEAERRCVVEGEQPKAAQMEKAKAKETVVDVWAEEGGLGIDF